jgi:hypothetical protein
MRKTFRALTTDDRIPRDLNYFQSHLTAFHLTQILLYTILHSATRIYAPTTNHNTLHFYSVGTALGYGLDDRSSRVRFPAGLGLLFTTASRMVLGPTQPPIQWVLGALSLGVKRPGREADHSPPSSVEVRECVELYLHSPNTSSWRGA